MGMAHFQTSLAEMIFFKASIALDFCYWASKQFVKSFILEWKLLYVTPLDPPRLRHSFAITDK